MTPSYPCFTRCTNPTVWHSRSILKDKLFCWYAQISLWLAYFATFYTTSILQCACHLLIFMMIGPCWTGTLRLIKTDKECALLSLNYSIYTHSSNLHTYTFESIAYWYFLSWLSWYSMTHTIVSCVSARTLTGHIRLFSCQGRSERREKWLPNMEIRNI